MKTKVIIEESLATIELTPENQFEIDILDNSDSFELKSYIDYDYGFVSKKNNRLIVQVVKKKLIKESYENIADRFTNEKLKSVKGLVGDDYCTGFKEGIIKYLEYINE